MSNLLPQLERAAYHEAGHVVAAYLLHRAFRHVTIAARDDDAPAVHFDRPPPYRKDWAEREIILMVAGPEAERRCKHGRQPGLPEDTHHACRLALSVTGGEEEASALVRQLANEIDAALTEPLAWAAVEAVAAALLDKGRLGYRAARAIIRKATGNAQTKDAILAR